MEKCTMAHTKLTLTTSIPQIRAQITPQMRRARYEDTPRWFVRAGRAHGGAHAGLKHRSFRRRYIPRLFICVLATR
jgi:hypothetical protein